MKTLPLLAAAAGLAIFFSPTARAADMPQSYWQPGYEPVYEAPPVASCFDGKVDDVWAPQQVAYIVAGSCTEPGIFGPRHTVLVYYNGGSMYRPDIRILREQH